jgi:hypothetical protein
MARYEFEPHAFFLRRDEADAQVIGEVLEQLTRENGGRLKGKHLVEAARKRAIRCIVTSSGMTGLQLRHIGLIRRTRSFARSGLLQRMR